MPLDGELNDAVENGAVVADAGTNAAVVESTTVTPAEVTTEGMQAAIKEGLAGTTPEASAKAAADAAAIEVDPVKKAAADKVAADTKAADEAKLKTVKVDDIKLSDAEKASLTPKANERFHALHKLAKAKEDENAQLSAQVAQFRTQHETFTNVLKDTHTAPEELGALLDYNFMLKTGKFEDALKMVEMHRAAIYKAMGREAPGVDLLADFPDLAASVQNNELTRDRAIEIGTSRRREALQAQQQQGQQAQQTQAQQAQLVQQNALASIDKWCSETAAKDIDFKAREEKLLPQIAEIMQDYPPNLWLKTIQRMYSTVIVPRETSVLQPQGALRPNGARPGPKEASNMFDAIKSGLGYSAAA